MVCRVHAALCTCDQVCPVYNVSVIFQALEYGDNPEMPGLESVEDDGEEIEDCSYPDTESLSSVFEDIHIRCVHYGYAIDMMFTVSLCSQLQRISRLDCGQLDGRPDC